MRAVTQRRRDRRKGKAAATAAEVAVAEKAARGYDDEGEEEEDTDAESVSASQNPDIVLAPSRHPRQPIRMQRMRHRIQTMIKITKSQRLTQTKTWEKTIPRS